MHSILINAAASGRPVDWSNFVREAGYLTMPLGGSRIAPNVWIVPLPDGEDLLTAILSLAKRNSILVRSLSIAHKAEWTDHL